MDQTLDKKYYKIQEAAAIIGVSPSTLRFWEKEFPQCAPTRSRSNIRYYKPEDLETLRVIYYLLKVKGLRIEAAKEQLRVNRENVFHRNEIIQRLEGVKSDLGNLLKALNLRQPKS